MNHVQKKELGFEKRKLHLSNERTFLSYVRTAASVLVLAVALLKFFDNNTAKTLGWISLVIGFLIIILGVYRYFSEKRMIHNENFQD